MSDSRLLYMMGASGVGKDSLLRELCRRRPDALVAHRYITRASGDGENCIELTPPAFAWRRERGLFCLDWEAHGLCYGVGIEVETWLAAGHSVILNGSRRALAAARARFGEALLPLLIVADSDVLRHRLIARGRETADEIEARLSRDCEDVELAEVAQIDNSGELARGVDALERWLDQGQAR